MLVPTATLSNETKPGWNSERAIKDARHDSLSHGKSCCEQSKYLFGKLAFGL